MPIKVFVTNHFEHMSQVAADIITRYLNQVLRVKKEVVLGLATGNSPTGLYKELARAANLGGFDSSRIRSFNLDEYIGLPGDNEQQRVLHSESYCYFMIQEFFGLLKRKFIETHVPYGTLVDQKRLTKELKNHPGDWKEMGANAGKSIVIKSKPRSKYLAWIQHELLNGYAKKIKKVGGIDLQVIGVGGKGHVAFHESGIPFKNSKVLLVKLDDNTVNNAVTDGHFQSVKESPRYAISMGAELVYQAETVVLLAYGERKTQPIAESLLGSPNPDIPISYGQIYANKGGNLIYVLDKIASRGLLSNINILTNKGVQIEVVS